MIVVEGPDNSGKTTLLKTISEAFRTEIHHSGGPPKYDGETLDRTAEYLQMDYKLYDRFPAISDQVYSPLFRGVNYFNTKRGQQLFKDFLLKRPLIVYCRPPDEVLMELENHKFHPENETQEHFQKVMANQAKIIETYDALMAQISNLNIAPMVQYDWTKDYDEKLPKILKVAADIIHKRIH